MVSEDNPRSAGFWEERYAGEAPRWERPNVNPAFVEWRRSGALAPCRIVVPGCGRAPELTALVQDGFDVTGLDVAPSAVAWQRERLGEAELQAAVLEEDVLSWRPDAPFDAAYEQTCLCALPPDLWPAYAAQLRVWLRPGGRLFALFMQTGKEGGPPFDCPLDAMEKLFGAEEWEWPQPPYLTSAHPSLYEEIGAILVRR